MASISLDDMRSYLSKSVSSINENKLRGLLAEVDFRIHLQQMGYADHVSAGGWIVRSEARGGGRFAENAAVFFPEEITIGEDYPIDRRLPPPPQGLHAIAATYHQIGIRSYYCSPRVPDYDHGLAPAIHWSAIQLGLPTGTNYAAFPDCIYGFTPRTRPYNYLRYNAPTDRIPVENVSEEFSKESVRVAFANKFFAEISDLDGIFWGRERTYPLEIKEKTVATDSATGDYFGLDIGPFVKLAYYAAKRGNLHSMFVVREIDDVITRGLVDWWFVTFETLAQFASWNFISGGRNMAGGRSATVKIPKSAFTPLNKETLAQL